MIQVWLIDENNFYTGKCDFVEEPKENEITKPYEVGYVKAKWDFELQDWIEGATAEEIQEWKDNKIDICPTPTIEEQLLATQKMVLSLQEQIIDMA